MVEERNAGSPSADLASRPAARLEGLTSFRRRQGYAGRGNRPDSQEGCSGRDFAFYTYSASSKARILRKRTSIL
jgi:hypothetical protein